MKRSWILLALSVLCAVSASGQEPLAGAREFLAWHSANDAVADDAELTRQAFFYLQAGAVEEARSVCRLLLERNPGNADAQRFEVAALSMDSRSVDQALQKGRHWLENHPDAGVAERDSVLRRVDFLEEESRRLGQVADAGSRSQWAVLLGVLFSVAFAWLTGRFTLRR